MELGTTTGVELTASGVELGTTTGVELGEGTGVELAASGEETGVERMAREDDNAAVDETAEGDALGEEGPSLKHAPVGGKQVLSYKPRSVSTRISPCSESGLS